MKTLKKYFLSALALLTVLSLEAQPGGGTMAETMRSNGRIYVVVAVVLTILLGLFFYVFKLDRKISRMEKENQ